MMEDTKQAKDSTTSGGENKNNESDTKMEREKNSSNRRNRKSKKKTKNNSFLIPSQVSALTGLNVSAKEFVPTTKNDDNVNNKSSNNRMQNVPSNGKTEDSNNNSNNGNMKKRRKPRNRQRKKNNQSLSNQDGKQENQDEDYAQNVTSNDNDLKSTNATKKNPKSRNRNRANRKRAENRRKYPWRKHIPNGTVDPISLDPLNQLTYPPFVLCISPPYTLIDETSWWKQQPLSESVDNYNKTNDQNQLEQTRQSLILQQQWGDKAIVTPSANEDGETYNDEDKNIDADGKIKHGDQKQQNHFHFFDGKCLAYYVVSTFQFIDPLNRRDLTMEEIKHLDAYMEKYDVPTGKQTKRKSGKVLEAYYAKGTPTINSAGIASQTQQGRTQLMQQEASVLLQSLFSNSNNNNYNNDNDNNSNSASRNAVTMDITNSNANSNLRNANRSVNSISRTTFTTPTQNGVSTNHNPVGNEEPMDVGIYAQDGMIMIDDDENPGLRGGLYFSNYGNSNSNHEQHNSSTNRRNIQLFGHEARRHVNAFPALESSSSNTTSVTNDKDINTTNISNSNNSRMKKKISKMIKKTDLKQIEKQKKARDEALRRSALAQMSFQQTNVPNSSIIVASTTGDSDAVCQAQMDRNEILASALGIAQPTQTKTTNICIDGWARPTNTNSSNPDNLVGIKYAPDLLTMALPYFSGSKELLKLERRWITFLQSNVDASLSLRPMNRQMRIFVHTYSDYWNLQTQSFDPEPRRYIHCNKLRDTRAPYPLLSTFLRTYDPKDYHLPPPIIIKPTLATASIPNKNDSNTVDNNSTIMMNETNNHNDNKNMSKTFSSNDLPQNVISHSFSRELLTDTRVPLKLRPPSSNNLNALNSNNTTESVNGDSVNVAPPAGAIFFSSHAHPPSQRFATLLQERDLERPKLQLAPRTLPVTSSSTVSSATATSQPKTRRIRLPQKVNHNEKLKHEKNQFLLEAAFFASEDEFESDGDSDWGVGEALYTGSSEEE